MGNEQELPLAGKIALVTGSGQGIGRATALHLAKAGADIVVNYRSKAQAAEETKASIEALGRRCITVQADVSQEEDVLRLFNTAQKELGPIAILVNNAGTTNDKLVLQMSLADFEQVIDTNLRSAFLCTRAALRGMMKARWGRIVNISSVSGLLGQAGQANYAASKAGMIALTLSTAREMASRNITVNAVAPGYVPTELSSKLNEQQQQAMIDAIPLKRFGSADEIAVAVCFLCLPQASYITGQILSVDGGMSMHI
ncbi:3-oxoacyl-[acyl-carrier-protein] reductase [Thermosporothrix hazakensis]|jgi:3-oxoacyl-[acyl-carrier protein] reductase|uniref:3-oxoacyl-[acyl-carrier-protein] reductase n=1 Tax=Thermosporothrix hazakensis TaxID=644383 RepID=A0A326U8B1_THEHA|nr:3-oxoacyl-[acyl-carrier-protein] reductase [Thermosporothrix hazakensis]PZW30639.1 3-oxoacyl-[acyl-carrier-protein] reductase [Thermosporothrix hazakensis]GCE49502.1 beta-ketoacyl-ACP reductase [Thermosporothrix hazakensis]